MPLRPEVVQAMIDAGATRELIAAAMKADWEADAAEQAKIRDVRREKARLKKQAQRARAVSRMSPVVPGDMGGQPYDEAEVDAAFAAANAPLDGADLSPLSPGVPGDPPSAKKVSPPPPSKKPNPPGYTQGDVRAHVHEGPFDREFVEEFWPAYPNRVGRGDARDAYREARARGASRDAILAGVARYATSKPADQKWLNPANFLRQERWADEPGVAARATGPPAAADGLLAFQLDAENRARTLAEDAEADDWDPLRTALAVRR